MGRPIDARPEIPDRTGVVLLASPADDDHCSLQRIFRQSAWRVADVYTCQDAMDYFREHVVAVVICERDMPDGSWVDLFETLSLQTHSPLMIVVSRLADERLWAEVLNRGGYDVLAKPFEPKEVTYSVASAWRHWEQQFGKTGSPKTNSCAA